jgi:hypothetical protein
LKRTSELAAALALCLASSIAGAQDAAPIKQVLILNSARLDEQFSQTV